MTAQDLRIGVVGAGYVGLTTAVCLAERGLPTVCVDTDARRVEGLAAGRSPIDEPELEDVMRAGMATGALRFTTDFGDLADCAVAFVCVPTPSGSDGGVDLAAVDAAVNQLATVLGPGSVIAFKSTVPVGTTRRVAERLRGRGIRTASVPEFLREGHAVHDFRHPDRVVVGTEVEADADTVGRAIGHGQAPVLRMSPESAELAKYASNGFLAVKLSYANSLAGLCAKAGADVVDVTRCMAADARIGQSFLDPGPGWGGSCLPKDTWALAHTARAHDVAFAEVDACRSTNAAQAHRVASALRGRMSRPLESARITALGLTFKAQTSDTRDSPALAVCAHLAGSGAHLSGYDPRLAAIDPAELETVNVTGIDDPYRASKAADAIVVLTEWPEFADLDWRAIAEQAPDAVVLDTRNTLCRSAVEAAGLVYLGNGRPGGF